MREHRLELLPRIVDGIPRRVTMRVSTGSSPWSPSSAFSLSPAIEVRLLDDTPEAVDAAFLEVLLRLREQARKPECLTLEFAYEPGAIPGNTRATGMHLLSQGETLEEAVDWLKTHLIHLLRDPMRPCGHPGPWA